MAREEEGEEEGEAEGDAQGEEEPHGNLGGVRSSEKVREGEVRGGERR